MTKRYGHLRDDTLRKALPLVGNIIEQAGKYRKRRVIITGTDFIPPAAERIPDLTKDFIAGLPGTRAKHHPVEFAAIIHRELVTIHPVIDGNGRAARLLMNLALLQAGCPVAIIPPILRRDSTWTPWTRHTRATTGRLSTSLRGSATSRQRNI
jgi:Fic family protein